MKFTTSQQKEIDKEKNMQENYEVLSKFKLVFKQNRKKKMLYRAFGEWKRPRVDCKSSCEL